MGTPTQPIVDIMRRTMANLAFVEERAGPNGPYEVTQLINSFVGALAHPWEWMKDDLMQLPLTEIASKNWPAVQKEYPTDIEPNSLGDLVRLMRNAMAHGNIELYSDGRRQISAIRVWNIKHGRRDWGAVVRIDDMRRFLECFVELIEERHKQHGWYGRQAA